MLDALLDDGFLIPTFEQLAALQIEYEGRVLGAHYCLGFCFLGNNIRVGLGVKGCFLPFHRLWKPNWAEQNR